MYANVVNKGEGVYDHVISPQLEDKPHDWLFFNKQVRLKTNKKTVNTSCVPVLCVPVVYKLCVL